MGDFSFCCCLFVMFLYRYQADAGLTARAARLRAIRDLKLLRPEVTRADIQAMDWHIAEIVGIASRVTAAQEQVAQARKVGFSEYKLAKARLDAAQGEERKLLSF